MYAVLLKTIDSLTPAQLEDIYKINKLNLQGFRLKGPSSTVKTKRMKTQLIKYSKLEDYMKETAEYYSRQNTKDYSWALASSIKDEEVRKKIEETNVGEVAYALIIPNKLSILKDILIPTINEKAQIISNEEVSNENVSTIKNLREIIGDLEGKDRNLSDSLKATKEKLTALTKNNKDLKVLYKETKEELTTDYQNIKNQYEEVEAELMKSEGLIGNLQANLKQTKLENENALRLIENLNMTLKKLNILFYGTNIYKRYIDTKLSSINNLTYDYYYYSLDEIEDIKQYQKIVILTFTLNQTEMQEIHENKYIEYFRDLFNIIFIASLEELNEYIIKVGRYYG